MALKIWKTALEIHHTQEIEVPAGAEMLCAREQHDQVMVWFRCDPEAPTVLRTILVRGTGHESPSREEGRYLGTASLQGGHLILHVFEAL